MYYGLIDCVRILGAQMNLRCFILLFSNFYFPLQGGAVSGTFKEVAWGIHAVARSGRRQFEGPVPTEEGIRA